MAMALAVPEDGVPAACGRRPTAVRHRAVPYVVCRSVRRVAIDTRPRQPSRTPRRHVCLHACLPARLLACLFSRSPPPLTPAGLVAGIPYGICALLSVPPA